MSKVAIRRSKDYVDLLFDGVSVSSVGNLYKGCKFTKNDLVADIFIPQLEDERSELSIELKAVKKQMADILERTNRVRRALATIRDLRIKCSHKWVKIKREPFACEKFRCSICKATREPSKIGKKITPGFKI